MFISEVSASCHLRPLQHERRVLGNQGGSKVSSGSCSGGRKPGSAGFPFILYIPVQGKGSKQGCKYEEGRGSFRLFSGEFLWNPTIPFKIKFSLVQSMAESKKKGNLEFSLGNLFSCLCFTTEDQVRDNFKLVTISGCLSGRCQEGSDDDG